MEQQTKKPFYKKWWFITIAVIMILGMFGDHTPKPVATTPTPQVKEVAKTDMATTTPSLSKEEATKEFNKLMELSKKAGLVTSYEMDQNTPLTIFVGKIWYTQTVQFKKDMIAKFSTLEQAMYGRHRLEVIDGYSNEKVAEVTAFSGSLEVYK